MPRRRGRRVRRNRRRAPQLLVLSVYAALQQGNHQIANLISGIEMEHRDYLPLSVSIQTTGTLGTALTFQLLGHDGDTIKDHGPYILGSTVRNMSLRWPRSTDWFPSGKGKDIMRVKILPCAGACPATQTAYVRLRCKLLVSDYDSGFTNQAYLRFPSPSADSLTSGVSAFDRLSIADRVEHLGTPPKRTASFESVDSSPTTHTVVS